MNLLVVEDEVGIRHRIVNTIPWADHGIEVVGEAESGQAALHFIELKKVDIVLMDIQMPEMDGLVLAEHIQLHSPAVKVIILSGYNDFEYARRAVEFGVLNYLLKPAHNEEILDTVLKAAELVRREQEQQYSRMQLEEKWRMNVLSLQSLFLQGVLSGQMAEWELERKSRELSINLPLSSLYKVVVAEMDPLSGEESRFSRSDESLLQFSLQCIIGELLAKDCCYVLQNAGGQTVILFCQGSQEPEDDFQQRVNYSTTKFLQVVKDCMKLTASAGIGLLAAGAPQIAYSYTQAKEALKERVVYGHHVAIHSTAIQSTSQEETGSLPGLKKLELALEASNGPLAFTALDEMINSIYSTEGLSGDIRVQVFLLAGELIRWVRDKRWPLKEVLGEHMHYFTHMDALVSREQIREWLRGCLQRIMAYMDNHRNHTKNKLIQSVIEMIEEHLDQDLSLNTIAERLFVNYSYLSRLFKLEVGIPYSQYILSKKMHIAKQLLLEGAQVGEAAARFGYLNVSFFSRQFQRYWGVLPSDIKAKGE